MESVFLFPSSLYISTANTNPGGQRLGISMGRERDRDRERDRERDRDREREGCETCSDTVEDQHPNKTLYSWTDQGKLIGRLAFSHISAAAPPRILLKDYTLNSDTCTV